MQEQKGHEQRIYSLLTQGDEITWQSLLYDLVKKEGMDPWDINVSALTKLYIDTLKELKNHDFRVSGKVLLAASILLKIKSHRLVQEDIGELDRLLSEPEEQLPDEIPFEDDDVAQEREQLKEVSLIPKTPQPRKRKVSLFDLMNALEKALEVKQRRVLNATPGQPVEAPRKMRDITEIIRQVYARIKQFFNQGKKRVNFKELAPSSARDDKIQTFVPLLHLAQQRKIELDQEKPFSDIHVQLALENKEEVEKGIA